MVLLLKKGRVCFCETLIQVYPCVTQFPYLYNENNNNTHFMDTLGIKWENIWDVLRRVSGIE